MIRSMTGYGRGQEVVDGLSIVVEIKSVNHRYFEFSSRLPRSYQYLEEKLKSFVQNKVSRGKVDVGVTIFNIEGNINYTALLYIPSHVPYDLYTTNYEKGLQLYTKGVFIMDKCKECLPCTGLFQTEACS